MNVKYAVYFAIIVEFIFVLNAEQGSVRYYVHLCCGFMFTALHMLFLKIDQVIEELKTEQFKKDDDEPKYPDFNGGSITHGENGSIVTCKYHDESSGCRRCEFVTKCDLDYYRKIEG